MTEISMIKLPLFIGLIGGLEYWELKFEDYLKFVI